MSLRIIVARYNEDVEWTKQFPNVILYNKGTPLGAEYSQVWLPNVGREGHTYYSYICENYDNLADHTVFLQGHPFDHSPNVIAALQRYVENIPNASVEFEFLSEHVYCASFDEEAGKYFQCANIHKNWERVFGAPSETQEALFGAGAQFIVAKHRILQRPKEFYQNIVQMLAYAVDPTEGYDIERFHKYVFM